MKKEQLQYLVRGDQLRRRTPDREKIKSMIESSLATMSVVKTIPLTDASATLIFRESYESIRQLGDARWWLLGYEPQNHEVSMNILKEMNLHEKSKLNHLNRFRIIRNDVNYRGFKVTTAQAQEIQGFWETCSTEIISFLQQELNSLC